MSINQLPNEILQNIFQHMYGNVVIQSRAVCRRWRDVVDGLPDALWERICLNDYLREDYKTARKKYGLPWRDVYKAINSWRNIRTVSMDWGLISENVQHFKVLPHGIIALLKNDRNKTHQQYSDTIVYYDLVASRICGREEFDFVYTPRYYDENDHFIALIKHEGTLVIVLKVNKTQYVVGNLQKYSIIGQEFSKLTIIDNEIYFQDRDDVIYVSRIMHENGVAFVHTQPIEYFAECVVAFSKKNGKLHVLTDEENIYILNESEKFKIEQHCWDLFHNLKCCGFDWRSRDVFEWLFGMKESFPLKKCYLHGNIILVAQKFNLKIFLTGLIMGKEELKSIVKDRAKRSIDMRRIITKTEPFTGVQQLDIVETPNEHKILVLAQKRLFVFELEHSTERMRLRSMNKRKADTDTDVQVLTKIINIPKKRKTGCKICDT